MENNLNYRKNINDNNNVHNLEKCKNQLEKKNYEIFNQGYSAKIFIAKSNECGTVIFKQNNEENIFKREITITNLVKNIILKDICPNFIYLFDIVNNIMILEYADGNLFSLLYESDIEFNEKIIKNIHFQILIGVLVLQKILFCVHYDLRLYNIYYKKISNQNIKYFEYNINGTKFYLENLGYLIMIADFGNSQTLLIEPKYNWMNFIEINDKILTNYDLRILKNTYWSGITKYIYDNKYIESIEDLYKILDLTNPKVKKILDEQITREKKAKERIDKISFDFILMKSIKKLLTNGLLDYKKYIGSNHNYLISNDYRLFLKSIYNGSNILNTLNSIFAEYKKNIGIDRKNIKTFNIFYNTFSSNL